MATCAQFVCTQKTATRAPGRSLLIVTLAVALPLLAGLLWHLASDNPVWPLFRNSLNRCELRDSPISPISPDGLYRAHIVQATCLGRFSETLVFVTGADSAWSLQSLDPNRAVLEVAGDRSLDAVNWENTSADGVSALQLWFVPSADPGQIHRIDRASGAVVIKTLTSIPAPGAERLDY
jgi:hypothetical protein